VRRGGRREWRPEELVACWTLVEDDWRLVGNKTGATRLGFGLLLKFFELEARFPRHAGELPKPAVDYVAGQVKVDPAALARYAWTGRTIEYHRAQIRRALGFREATRDDERKLADWLAAEVAPVEPSDERVREALRARCRAERIEPPGRAERMVRAARAAVADRLCQATVARLSPEAIEQLAALVAEDQDEPAAAGRGRLAELKADPGKPSLDNLLAEIAKLNRLRAIGLPADLFAETPDKLVGAWRARAASEYPAWLRKHAPATRLTLLAALCWSRQTEIIDGLVGVRSRFTGCWRYSGPPWRRSTLMHAGSRPAIPCWPPRPTSWDISCGSLSRRCARSCGR
jgi:hypothetical protein